MKAFRQGIVAVLKNERGQVLLAERSDIRGSWQFPQGGLKYGETPRHAFFREVEEELGNANCEVLAESPKKTSYLWPEPGRDVVGQEQTWFLARYNPGEEPVLDRSDGCFRAWRWAQVSDVLGQTVEWKRPAYRQGLEMLGLL